jgi:hypothetical protein
MSDTNYGLGFYLIPVSEDHFDLYNSATDKKILSIANERSVINFLELNHPTHPFLYRLDCDSDSSFSYTTSMTDAYSSFKDFFSDPSDWVSRGHGPSLDLFNSEIKYSLSEDEKDNRTFPEPVQLEIPFPKDNDDTTDTLETNKVLPFLPEDK